MENFSYIIIILMVATLLVIVSGIGLLAINNKMGKKYTTKLMALRIILQASVIILVGILVLFGKKILN